jgi:hypothetical protein
MTALLGFNCSTKNGDNIVSNKLKDVAGGEATDCGRVGIGEDAAAANECSIRAIRLGRPFLVQYDVQGLDTRLVVGLARDDNGRVVMLKYDPEGWDRNIGLGGELSFHNRLLTRYCGSPTRLQVSHRGYLSCESE